jgi:hypothetical protein
MAVPTQTQTWEQVLAAVEADAARTARLLSSTEPVELGEPPVLPALADMPAVPDALRERITGLRDRIAELQAELAAELAAAVHAGHALPLLAAATPPAAPQYVDRRV